MLIGYTRCSTKDQVDGSTIQEQERMIRGIAMIRGVDQFDVVFFSDPAVSGSISLGRRPQGADMMANLKKGDIIIAAKLDRLFRSASDALYVVEKLHERGIGIIFANMGPEPVTENGTSKLFFTMLAAFAEFERVCIQERTVSGREAKKELGGCVGAIPYGWYKRGHGRGSILVENFEEQRVIAAMVKLRDQDQMTYQDIANALAQDKCFNRAGQPFGRGQIHAIVKQHREGVRIGGLPAEGGQEEAA
jgi:DNA invertase Pin-like site-specific DNA recombinase